MYNENTKAQIWPCDSRNRGHTHLTKLSVKSLDPSQECFMSTLHPSSVERWHVAMQPGNLQLFKHYLIKIIWRNILKSNRPIFYTHSVSLLLSLQFIFNYPEQFRLFLALPNFINICIFFAIVNTSVGSLNREFLVFLFQK